ncbi:hypothetical protein Ahy_A06g028909 [Arachis hypogaea]|uniref:Uncharacterized protein n=1 Tax=Arachis hypogaea TaxID=3818 RepID=A0A445CS31_ARAHY|nr:hypothetical protein Ahy_A06g028909 [Arachis hypogaea]
MKYFKKNFEFDYDVGIKWALRILGDRWKAISIIYEENTSFLTKERQKFWLRISQTYRLLNRLLLWIIIWILKQRNREKLIVSHVGGSKSNARRAAQMYYYTITIKLAVLIKFVITFNILFIVLGKKLGRLVCRSEVIVSTLLKKDGSYVSGKGQRLAEKIAKHLSEDQDRAATEDIHSKVLAHPDDAIEKVCGPKNSKRVHGFSNVACPSGFGKSKCIFGGAICGGSRNASQQHVSDLERQLQEVKGQVATLYKFL